MKFVSVLVILFVYANADMARFDNYRVYTVTIENEEQYKAMKYLEENSDAYDFWKSPKINGKADIVVPPHKFADFEVVASNLNMQAEIIIENLQRLIDEERPRNKQPKAADADALDLGWDDYHTLEEIYDWLDEMKEAYPQYINVTTIGYSSENRPIRLLSLSKKPGNRAILIEGTIHAREWISPATATYILYQLLTSEDPEIVDIATNIDWHFIPVINPDGYTYTWTTNRNWRKTRAPVSMLCFGVDGNRNFEYNWLRADETGDLGGSKVPCTDTYAGAYPYSEPETRATEGFLNTHASTIDAFLALHSYGHLFLHPWGHTIVPPTTVDELGGVGRAAAAAILAVNGIQYTVGSSNGVLYASTGTSRDHTYGHHHIPISFTVEMRGNGPYGNYGFFLPAEYILPNAQEVIKGFIALIHRAREFGRFPIN
ncbi:hypothetical protein PVAND_002185 [Polypedilum vanderplanki]|uniref:Zinc carboxypeptidase A 1 n=1 Tax=Polypedilum vanderplanki TaxID=319348 RepID=A0A9J6BQI4_POLVA|nr:hypothetical protein PVAND_002185 [Polypedilum vanderplanki]